MTDEALAYCKELYLLTTQLVTVLFLRPKIKNLLQLQQSNDELFSQHLNTAVSITAHSIHIFVGIDESLGQTLQTTRSRWLQNCLEKVDFVNEITYFHLLSEERV